MYKRQTISSEEIARQRNICSEIFQQINASHAHPLALVDTYGCQQNEADSEKIRG
jgi:tRNA-2-methylthio-N6-dimethylallyladenosine synthase